MSGSRFDVDAAAALRDTIREAGGVEVFAVGDVELGQVVAVTITCRGTEDRVPALLDRPRAGQVVIHNHPSGDLRPSDPDLQLAHLYGEDGVGVVIVDNDVERAQWVVEPHVRTRAPVDDTALLRFFREGLPRALPGWEAREQQLEMARRVAASLEHGQPVLCEAGTGTGKSLAYLAPAALWALANDSKVVVSTFTRALQAQLVASDLPLLARGGITARTAVLQGRSNYLCRRRLALAISEADDPERVTLDALAAWSESTSDGSRSDLPFAVDAGTWEHVLSDSELSLSIRCPHYEACHYYRARRGASGAHVIVVNHALLLTDLALRAEAGRGFLPRYERVILDEAHHLEDAATGVASSRLTATAVRRAIRTLRGSRARKGALSLLYRTHVGGNDSPLSAEARVALTDAVDLAERRLMQVETGADAVMSQIADALLDPRDGVQPAKRVTPALEATSAWNDDVSPLLRHLGAELTGAAQALDQVAAAFEGVVLPEAQMQPLLDVRRARGRLADHAGTASSFLQSDPDRCRWVESARDRNQVPEAALCAAPIEVGPVLGRILWTPLPGTACTSATLTVAGSFASFARRTGLPKEPVPDEVVFPSPFDHARQAVLGLPRDLPTPDDPRFLEETAKVVVEAVAASDGGAFVLCTSYAAVKAYGAALRRVGDRPVLAQGDAGRAVVLERFRADRRAVLVGTDSFWEGVSVRGDGLRLVIIPRLPFRVPTEPLQQARHERIAARGGDPFKALSLPDAVVKLRQGYGRLIRSHTDRGAVVILDRRVHDRAYGTVLLRSLPPAKRITGPWRVVRAALSELF
jgi:ATP-dependent DNA helicase DinG